MNIEIDTSIAQIAPGCRIGYVKISDVVIKGTPLLLSREYMDLQATVCEAYNLDILPRLPRIAAVRTMYRNLHFDPTRYRPAAEALIRRVLQHKKMPFVNSAVDVNNYCSLKFLLPFGLYDADKIQGSVAYQMAPSGTYVNITGHETSTEDKPFLTDQLGVFGNPTSDSRRTAVTLATRNLLSVVYADAEVGNMELAEIMRFTGDMLVRYNSGIIGEKSIVTA
jgi:DNA/RNA-binding domain of Phe-tRNA-synthetase-like protein